MSCSFRIFLPYAVVVALTIGSTLVRGQEPVQDQESEPEQNLALNQELTPAEALAIAREAYGFGLPIVENYNHLYAEAIDKTSEQYMAPLNVLKHEVGDLTAVDTLGPTPNLDLLRSWLWMDLRAEPVILEVPEIEEGRFYSIQLIDLYTFNFDYIGTRTTGSGAGRYLIAGPDWKGEVPEGIEKIIRCETQFALAKYRLQVRGVDDFENAKQIQSQFKVQTLSTFLGQPAPEPAAAVDFPQPEAATGTDLVFFTTLNFLLRFCPTHPSEAELMERLARIGVGADTHVDMATLSPDIRAAIGRGMEEADAAIIAGLPTFKSTEIFGTREFLQNDYMKRAVAAKVGLYGNSREEFLFPLYLKDGEGNPLDTSKTQYVLKLSQSDFPPVNGFWSITLYDSQNQRPVANPIARYQIASEMLPTLKRNADDGITLYIQQESPGDDRVSNWLPAPDGPFYMVMRLYSPNPLAYEGTWSPALVWPEASTPQADVKPTGVEATEEVKPSTLVEEPKPEMERPTVWGEPTEVQIGIYVIDVDEVDSADQSFAASVYFQAQWKNPLLRHKGPGPLNRGLSDVWNPRLTIIGQQMAWKSYPEAVEIQPDGTVIQRQKVWGRFSQPLDLRNFPFDQQTLSVQVVAAGLMEEHVKMVPLATGTGGGSGIASKFSLPDFDIVSWDAESAAYYPGRVTNGVAGYEMKINIARQPTFYILKVIIPLCLIVIMSWLPRWIDPEQSGTNIGISTSAFLTLVAYLFAITVLLPRVSYVTRIDRFILLSTLTVFAGLLQTVANTALLKNDKQKWVERMDFASRFAYPLLLVLVIVLSFVL